MAIETDKPSIRSWICCIFLLPAAVAFAASEPPRIETQAIPASAGIELATDLYHPAKEPAPVVLVRTPYGRSGLAFLGEALAARGYVAAIQDVRGKYDSTGDHEPFRHERVDGLASLKWIAAQDWCNGRIGMWGSSYSGYAALVLADADVAPFRSIFSISGWLDVEEVVRPGGANHLLLNLPWMLSQQGRVQRSLNEFDVDALFGHLPLRDALRSAGIRNSTWEDPSWMDGLARQREIGKVRRPVFQLTGWHDMVYRATLDAWRRLSARAEAPQKLAIGPWYHNQFLFGSWEVGEADFGRVSGFGADEMIALALRWFDATLRDEDDGILSEPPVAFFVMGQNAWHREGDWPPPGNTIREQRWYLDSEGGANGSDGNGVLSRAKPSGEPADRFVFDPHDPVPTHGGANFFYFPDLLGVRDQREIERRDDVLVYTSAPLDDALQITGPIAARLHVASSGKDTDFTAKLVVVRPDGYARIVEEGIARASGVLERVPPPGEPFALTVDMGHTAISVPPGHRLRLEVSSSNFPKYDRNPNNGADAFLAAELDTANQTVYHERGRASHLLLPVRRRALVASATGRQPLVSPEETAPAPVAAVEGDDAAELLSRGRQQLDDDDVDAAIATLEKAAELKPDGSAWHLWLGRAYLAKLNEVGMLKKLGWSKKTRMSFQRAVELDPDNVDARSSLARFYFQAPGVAGGSFEKGREQVAEIATRDAKAAHMLMASAYRNRKEPEKAKQEYRSAIELDPADPDGHYALGVLCQTEKQWDAAFEAFEAGVEAADDLRSLYQIGRTGVFSGQRLSRAQEALERYIAREPESARLPSVAAARWRLGMVYERQGKPDAARREYETALALDPGLTQAREALDNLDR